MLNKMKSRETLSRELQGAAPTLGLLVASHIVRDLQASRDAAQQGSVVTRMGSRAAQAASDINGLFTELLGEVVADLRQVTVEQREVGNG